MRTDWDDFVSHGSVRRAERLNTETGQLNTETGQVFVTEAPAHYFFGDPDSELVLVHLNGRAARANTAEERRVSSMSAPGTFEEYFDLHRHFGARQYGPSSPRIHRSVFDYKQIRFLRPFGVIDFVEERGDDDRFTNLERVSDRKFQLELVPYGSPSFSTRGLAPSVLKPHLDRALEAILAADRRYVLFCGAVFGTLLGEYVVGEDRFHLRKGDGGTERQASRFSRVEFRHGGRLVRAGLALSWARQGIPMGRYAEEVLARYEG